MNNQSNQIKFYKFIETLSLTRMPKNLIHPETNINYLKVSVKGVKIRALLIYIYVYISRFIASKCEQNVWDYKCWFVVKQDYTTDILFTGKSWRKEQNKKKLNTNNSHDPWTLKFIDFKLRKLINNNCF